MQIYILWTKYKFIAYQIKYDPFVSQIIFLQYTYVYNTFGWWQSCLCRRVALSGQYSSSADGLLFQSWLVSYNLFHPIHIYHCPEYTKPEINFIYLH